MYQILGHTSNGSAIKAWTDGHTKETESITSTADVGGNNSAFRRS